MRIEFGYTFTGQKVDLLNFEKSDINLYDIAISLSRQNRYAGHTAMPFSVGHHLALCVMLAEMLDYDDDTIKCVFLHDVEETWVQDVIWPIKKNFMMGSYDAMCDSISDTVYDFFGLAKKWNDPVMKQKVHDIDLIAYHFEAKGLIPAYRYNADSWSTTQIELIRQLNEKQFTLPISLANMTPTEIAQATLQLLTVIEHEGKIGGEVA